MARRASFGRAPRVTQSLTNTLVAIAREMQARRDSNLIDAWKGGGMFEGQKATDELVLAHWKKRLAAVSKDDPLWDTYNNAYMQYDYAINESKMSVLHAQGKISDAAAGQFYINWAKKVPRNSEFWRILQRDGAQMMERAKARNLANQKQREEDAYNASQSALDSGLKPAQYLVDLMTNLAQSGAFGQSNLINGPSATNGYEGQGLGDFDPSDPGVMSTFLASIVADGPVDVVEGSKLNRRGNQGAVYVYTDPATGKAMTGNDIIAIIRANDPDFDGNLTTDYVSGVIKDSISVLDDKIALATRTGHISDAAALSKQRASAALQARQVAAYPAEQSYLELNKRYEADMKTPGKTPEELIAIDAQYSSDLKSLANDKSLVGNDFMRNRLLDEANHRGGATMYDGFANNDPTAVEQPSQRSQDLNAIFERAVEGVEFGQSGGILTQGEYDKNGVFIPGAFGRSFDYATQQEIDRAGGGVQSHIVYVQTAGGPVAVTAIGSPIVASSKKPDGSLAPKQGSDAVAVAYDVPGVPRGIGYRETPGGPMLFTTFDTPPWSDKVVLDADENGYYLDLSLLLPPADANGNYQGVLPPGFTRDGKGGYRVEPAKATFRSDDSQNNAGFNPLTTHPSLILATLLSTPDGRQMMETLSDDPAFLAQVDKDSWVAAGGQLAADGSYVPGSADQALYTKFQTLGQNVINSNSLPTMADFVTKQSQLFDKENHSPRFQDDVVTGHHKATGFKGDGIQMGGKLPMDELKGTQFEAFGTMTGEGNNVLSNTGPFGSVEPGATIKLGGGITVPDASAAVKSTTTILTPATTGQNAATLGGFLQPTPPASANPIPQASNPNYRGPR